MKRTRSLFLFLLLGAAPVVTVRAQEEQLLLDPPLREAFPLEVLPGAVRVKYPVLLSDHMILRPEAVLHFIYLDPNAGLRTHNGGDSDGGSGFRSHIGPAGALSQNDDHTHPSDGGATGGWGKNDGDDTAGIFDDNKKDDAKRRKSELQTEVWTQKDLFTDALDHATELGTTVVYSLPPRSQPLTASLDLPEGMLLAEVDGHVRVLGLSDQSRAFSGGIRAGDEIRSFDGGGSVATLDDFIREYTATKRRAKVSGNSTYGMEIWRDGQSVSIQIAAPPTIPSFF
jgi:hypothetical protein